MNIANNQNKCYNKEIPQYIIDEFNNICGSWRMHLDEPIYIIGLSEDRYDFYYVGINNKEHKLHFISCVHKLDKCAFCNKQWNPYEKKCIKDYVNLYFNEHENENLLCLSI